MPTFAVEKSIEIKATPNDVFDYIRDFKNWPTWSPWLIAEPDCVVDYADDGKSYHWDGNVVGSGQMQIEAESHSQSIDYQLNFLKPWKSEAKVRFALAEKNGDTKVTWSMDGSLPIFMFWMKKMMIALVGMDYERGLKMLKPCIETGTNPSRLEFPGQTTLSTTPYVGITTECGLDQIDENMSRDFSKLKQWLKDSKTEPNCNPFTIYHRFDMVNRMVHYTAGFPVANPPTDLPEGVIAGERPACSTFAIKHTGPYPHLGNAWSAGMFRARNKVIRQSKKIHPFETYENDMNQTPENDLVTIVHFPLK